MGWSSWNTYHVNISDSLIMRQADAMVAKGLKAAGYSYINIDDGFFGGRNKDGRLIVHPTRFPMGMKSVADYIHSYGLKAGIYSEAGNVTCGSIYDNDSLGIGSGMYAHEEDDARLFFHDWGYDFIKIDYCGAKRQHLDEQEQYTRICKAISAAAGGRDVSVNLCRWAFPGTWAAEIARSWRISSDIRPKWSSIKNIIEKNLYLSAYCHDGHYNDMDMLEIGRGLKPNEEDTHFALWCIMSSPLLIGCDLTKIPDRSLRLITNPELIALNQDPLGLQAYVVQREGDNYVLVKDIEKHRGQTRAVALYNGGETPHRFSVPLSILELEGATQVRELISRKDYPMVTDSLVFTVPAHSTCVYKLMAQHRLEPTTYEAEWAWLPCYNDLGKEKSAIAYEQHSGASGGVVVTHAGGRRENSIVWKQVYSEQGGSYQLTIHYVPAPHRNLTAVVNGKAYVVCPTDAPTATLMTVLQPGNNTIELTSETTWMPDIDKIELRKMHSDVPKSPIVRVARYFGNRRAAVSLTFDDGLLEHFTEVLPQLRRRELCATFGIIGSKVGRDQKGIPCMTWAQLRQMASEGQEIASHGWSHKSLPKLTGEELYYEVQHNDSAIFDSVGVWPCTYFYPGNSKNVAAIDFASQGRVGTRTRQVSLGSKRDDNWCRKWLSELLCQGDWGISMTHGITHGYDAFNNPQVLWTLFDQLHELRDSIWTGTFHDVSAYVKERDAVRLETNRTKDRIEVRPVLSLDPHLFSMPLTLILPERTQRVLQDGHKLKIYRSEGQLCSDVNPYKPLTIIAPVPTVSLSRLTVEGRQEPFGLDEKNPRFGWVIESDKKDVRQTSYRLQVAASNDFSHPLWDSGEQHSEQSQWVEIPMSLSPNTCYYWRVKVKTNKGECPWMQGKWSTGLFSDTNWKGDWIGFDSLTSDVRMERHSRIAVRHLRKSFTAKKAVRRATAHVCGLGYYIFNINGQRIGDYLLAPAPTQYDKAAVYDTYDVTSYLLPQTSYIEVQLAGGYFFPMTQNYQTNVRTSFGMPKLRMNLIVEYEDGTTETIVTDKTWQVAMDGPIRYANLYDGTLTDYRQKPTQWMPVQIVEAPCKTLRGNVLGGVMTYAAERPFSVKKTGDDRFILDFGTNNTGRIFLPQVPIGNGDTIIVRYAEILQSDSCLYTANLRQAENTDYFVGNGGAVDMTTEFLWHGFRYAEVTGLKDNDVHRIMRQLMTDDLLSTASIDVNEGDGMINKILANARRGVLSNYKGIPMDCPQRDERMPWLGDRTMGCYGESYLTYNHTLYAKWLQDICDAQRKDGGISDVCPAYWRLYNNNMTWPAALPFGMEMMRLQYGDERPMRQHADNVRRFLALARKKAVSTSLQSGRDGLITYDRYGDWCVPPASLDEVVTKDSTRMTDGALLSSCYYYYICKLMGMNDEASVTRDAINRTFLKDDSYSNGTVTANLLPLAMDIVPDSAREAVLSALHAKLSTKDPHIDCGVIGISWLMRYLSKAGLGEVAYQIASTKTYPGWGYMVENGATTIWELWNGNTANPSMNSGNHVMMLGDFIPWVYECLAGIAPDPLLPGFKHIVMRPDFSITQLNGVNATFPSVYGNISSCWQRKGNHVTWYVTIPANTTATLYMPDGTSKTVGSGSYIFKKTYH